MNNRISVLIGLALLAAPMTGGLCGPSTAADALTAGFTSPPQSARPRVWWHWMNGNVTRQGIERDLQWMKRVGIGGFQNFDASLATPQVVDKRLAFMTPEWQEAFRFTAELADRLGLEMAIAGSPGWSQTGGPWVTPAQAMKKFVWSELQLKGGTPFKGKLPLPPAVTGPFQDKALAGLGLHEESARAEPPHFYADAAVIAYRSPVGAQLGVARQRAKITSSGGAVDELLLGDGSYAKAASLAVASAGEAAWIQYEYARPENVRGVTLSLIRNDLPVEFGGIPVQAQLQTSSDGVKFSRVADIPTRGGFNQDPGAYTVAVPTVTARFFRVSLTRKTDTGGPYLDFGDGRKPPSAPREYLIAECALHADALVDRYQDKAGFSAATRLYDSPTPEVPAEAAIARHEVIDLSARVQPDGTLEWTPPPGQWLVLRFGHSLTGHTNGPASAEATGLEVDKLSRAHVRAYLDRYLGMYGAATGGLIGQRGLGYVLNDSWEAGAQNWTDDMIAEFHRRRGYDLRTWMPVLAGRVVESARASDAFLWDFRKTLGELIASHHYGEIASTLHERGMGHYAESHENGRAFVGDGMETKRFADIPMGAMWTQQPGVDRELHNYNADVRESASVAHVYGQNLAAAESLTAPPGSWWGWSPESLKPTADNELAQGINRFVIHTSVHQPLEGAPGLSLGPVGQWFTRHETWAELAAPWVDYLARSSFLLQQGRYVADVAYYYGEDSNVTALFGEQPPPIPPGHNFDYVNADALLRLFAVERGELTTPSGMRYRVLVLDANSRHMTVALLRKLRQLLRAGASVSGPKPIDTPSLADDPGEFRTLVGELWGSAPGCRAVGLGQLCADLPLADVLKRLEVAPDFEHSGARELELKFLHRRLADGELYFVSNRHDRELLFDATFRVQGRVPELWHADSGKRARVSYSIIGGRTTVPLKLEPYGAVFVVFRAPTSVMQHTLPEPSIKVLGRLEGPWTVRFEAARGAPERIELDALTSWTEHAEGGVKYFSGIGTYTRALRIEPAWVAPGARLWLDLGEVKNIAEVSINGRPVGVTWKRPFRVDITDAVRAGDNALQIRVANTWVNRMIGDAQPDAERRIAVTPARFYKADSPLLPSGLLGPVRLQQITAADD